MKMLKKLLKITILFTTFTLQLFAGSGDLQDIVYEYDKLNRVTKATYSTGESISYSYDAGGNLLKVVFDNPNKAKDSDGDGYSDDKDAFPNDPNEWLDTDGDGIGDNADTDDDGDGISDADEIKYGLDPKDPSDANQDSDGDGVSNIDEIKAGTNPNDVNSNKTSAPVEVYFAKDQRVLAGEEANITLLLADELSKYPTKVSIKEDEEGTTLEKDDYTISSKEFIFTKGKKATQTIRFKNSATCDDELGSRVVFELDNLDTKVLIGNLNRRTLQRFYVVCHKDLKGNIEVRQQNKPVSVIHDTSVIVDIVAITNTNEVTYDWSDSDSELLSYVSTGKLTLNSIRLALEGIDDGSYGIVLKIIDSEGDELVIKRKLIVKQNSTYIDIDEDGDGISDVFDHIREPNILQTEHQNETSYLIEAREGEKLELGDMAREQTRQGALLDISKLPKKEGYVIDEVFDFRVTGVEKGGVAQVVIPLRNAIGKDAIYFKYSQDRGWREFIVDDKNRVESAQAIKEGVCPTVGSSAYRVGLIEGYSCIQLTIEDGGVNDNDGLVNGEVLDPSGVGNKKTINNTTDNNISTPNSSSGGGGGALGYILPLLLMILMFRRRDA